jgi:Phosphotransferase enzyme family
MTPPGLEDLIRHHFPGARVVSVTALAPDATSDAGATAKSAGHGKPLRVVVEVAPGQQRTLVLHFAAANPFGHDRRADRAAEILLADDTFGRIPWHARALDVGAQLRDGRLLSLRESGELWLLSEWAPGHVYADELRELAGSGRASGRDDLARVQALARYLVELHSERQADVAAYRRAIRDLVGDGEGIFGIVDAFPDDVPGAPLARLEHIEERCLDWRWRLRGRHARLARTHGDFHPFNVVFDGPDLALLDASRGGHGDPADDVTAMAINFVFFALGAPLPEEAWARSFAPLWRTFLQTYMDATGDEELLEVAAPFLAWRGLVLASPVWYPELGEAARHRLLAFVEAALDADRFDPSLADEVFG